MRKLVTVLIVAAFLFGVVSIFVPTDSEAGWGPRLDRGRGKKCQYICDPVEYPPPCGPCERWDSCGPNCGCEKIPGCKTTARIAPKV